MRRFVLMLSCILLVFMLSPVNGFALQYRYEDWDYEFDDTNYWINGWCYRPFDESEKTAILVAYDPNIIKGDVLVIPESINGYKINGFSHGLFQRSTFKSCDLSSFPNLAKRMFDESSLEHVILSKETKKIPDGCFLDCPLETIELHEGIETIESYAFRGTKLKELVIPSTVKEMGFQVISYCPELKKIEFKNGALTEINENSLSLGSTFMVEKLETLILPENITYIGENEFKVAEAGRHGFNFIKYPDNLTIYGKKGSYAEAYAAEHELSFVAIETKFEPLDIISEEIISEWAKIGVEKAIELGFVPVSFRDNYKRNITRGEFAKIAMFFLSMQYGYSVVPEATYYSLNEVDDNSLFPPEFMNAYACSKTDRNGKAFRDKYDEEKYVYHNTNVEIKLPELSFSDLEECKDLPFIERAYHIGIVNGISEKEFNPDGDITRQEAAAMLMRVYKNYAEVEKQDSEFEFSDDEKISAWAKEDVYNINALGIMKGVGEDNFAPLDGYTIEQAIVTFWRLYDLAPVSRKNKNITPLLDYEFESENYYDRDGGSYFHELTRKKYEDFIYVYGYWTQRHSTASTYSLYVFDKYGGVALEMFANDDFRWEVNSNGKVLTTYWHHTDTFKRYDKNIGTEKEYEKGMYQAKYDMEKRKILSYEKVE